MFLFSYKLRFRKKDFQQRGINNLVLFQINCNDPVKEMNANQQFQLNRSLKTIRFSNKLYTSICNILPTDAKTNITPHHTTPLHNTTNKLRTSCDLSLKTPTRTGRAC